MKNLFLIIAVFPLFVSAISSDRKDYPAIVQLSSTSSFKGEDKWTKRRTAFFISPDTLVTAFPAIKELKAEKNVNEYLTVETIDGKIIPVDEIIALDAVAGLAVLKIKNYRSKHYYSINKVSLLSLPLLLLKKPLILAGFFNDEFRVSSSSRMFRAHMDSGSPLIRGQYLDSVFIRPSQTSDLFFAPVEELRELLSKPFLSCFTGACVVEELDNLVVRAEKGERSAKRMLSKLDIPRKAIKTHGNLFKSLCSRVFKQ